MIFIFQSSTVLRLIGLTLLTLPLLASSQSAAQPLSNHSVAEMAKGECLPRQEVLNRLDHEAQYVLIAAEWTRANGNTGERYITKFAFSSSKDFSTGYHINSDQGGNLCKATTFANIILLRSHGSEIDGRAYDIPRSRASRGTLNQIIDTALKNAGEVPIFKATNELGTTVTILANIASGEGAILLSGRDSTVQTLIGLKHIRYSDVAKATLGLQ